MSSDVICPDCSSQNVQKIEEKETTTSRINDGLLLHLVLQDWGGLVKNCIYCTIVGFVLFFFIVFLCSPKGDSLGEALAVVLILAAAFGILFGFSFTFFVTGLKVRKKSEDGLVTKTTSRFRYVCRSCGREFRRD